VVHFDARTICASQNCQLFPTEFALQNIRPDTPAELPKGTPQSSGETSAATPKEEPSETADNLVALESQGGTYVVPVLINNAITLNFVVDSGASDVTIPADVVMTLVRTGTLKEEDFIGSKTYTLADGSTVPSATFRIKSLKVGDRMIDDVTAGIAPVQGTLLLGHRGDDFPVAVTNGGASICDLPRFWLSSRVAEYRGFHWRLRHRNGLVVAYSSRQRLSLRVVRAAAVACRATLETVNCHSCHPHHGGASDQH
jgi:Aspartyl protease